MATLLRLEIPDFVDLTLNGEILSDERFVNLSLETLKERFDHFLQPYTASYISLDNIDLKIPKIMEAIEQMINNQNVDKRFELLVYFLKRFKDVLSYKRIVNKMPNDIKEYKNVCSLIDYASKINCKSFDLVMLSYITQLCNIPFGLPLDIFNKIKAYIEGLVASELGFNQELSYAYANLLSRSDTNRFLDVEKCVVEMIEGIQKDSNAKILFPTVYYYIKKTKFSSLSNIIDRVELLYFNILDSLSNESKILDIKYVLKAILKIMSYKLHNNNYDTTKCNLIKLTRLLNSNLKQVREFVAKVIAKFLGKSQNEEILNAILNEIIEKNEKVQENLVNFVHGSCLTIGFSIMYCKTIDIEVTHRILNFVCKYGIKYDFVIGSREFGSNIRDSIAFILWALFKYYSPSVYCDYKKQLEYLIVFNAITDRQRLVRFAFSSALQEFIGRSGFADAKLIEIVSMMNNGILKKSFSLINNVVEINVSLMPLLIEGLSEKAYHWDESLANHVSIALCEIFSNYPENSKLIIQEFERSLSHFESKTIASQAINHSSNLIEIIHQNIEQQCLKNSAELSYRIYMSDNNVKFHKNAFIYLSKSIQYVEQKLDIDVPQLLDKLVSRVNVLDNKIKSDHSTLIQGSYCHDIMNYFCNFDSDAFLKYLDDTFAILEHNDKFNAIEISKIELLLFVKQSTLSVNVNKVKERLKYLYDSGSITLKCTLLKIFEKSDTDPQLTIDLLLKSLLNFKKTKNGDIGLKLRKIALNIVADNFKKYAKYDHMILDKFLEILPIHFLGNMNFGIACFSVFRSILKMQDESLYNSLEECLTLSDIIDKLPNLMNSKYETSLIKSLLIMPSSNYDYFEKAINSIEHYFMKQKQHSCVNLISIIENVASDQYFFKNFYSNFLYLVDQVFLSYFPSDLSATIIKQIEIYSSKQTVNRELRIIKALSARGCLKCDLSSILEHMNTSDIDNNSKAILDDVFGVTESSR
ncbi:MAG: hypothetical protein MHMPM18_000703 [Marteilia pararefringens]